MDDVVAVEVMTDRGRRTFFVTWGRIQDEVDPGPLEELILAVAPHFAVPGAPTSARWCTTLQEAREAPLFFEALLWFAHRPIPFGDGYAAWRGRMAEEMKQGKEIYFAGPWDSGSRSA